MLARPRQGEFTIRPDDIEAMLEKQGDQIALVLLAGVNFFTGQLFDIERITAAGAEARLSSSGSISRTRPATCRWPCTIGTSISRSGVRTSISTPVPGAVAGAFVHERHATNRDLPRLAGWWGNDPNTRFRMHLEPEFIPVPSADGGR